MTSPSWCASLPPPARDTGRGGRQSTGNVLPELHTNSQRWPRGPARPDCKCGQFPWHLRVAPDEFAAAQSIRSCITCVGSGFWCAHDSIRTSGGEQQILCAGSVVIWSWFHLEARRGGSFPRRRRIQFFLYASLII